MKLKTLLMLVAVAVLWNCAPSYAENPGAYFKLGQVEFTYPLANASAIALYDFWSGRGLMGAETCLVTYKAIANVNFGAVTSFQANGMPFVSLDFNFSKSVPVPAKLGLWYGHDFKANDNGAGVKASVPLW
jgi:hypothetical protein